MKVSLNREDGFTLFELTAVLFWCSLVCPAVPGLRDEPAWKKSGIMQLTMDLKELQSEARGRRGKAEFILYPDQDYYSITTGTFSLKRPLRGLRPLEEEPVVVVLGPGAADGRTFLLKGESGAVYRITIHPHKTGGGA